MGTVIRPPPIPNKPAANPAGIAIPAGFAAGLFGIGGGLITVPILFYIFGVSGIEPDYLMHLAVGTSFGIIIPTSFVSVLTHHQHNAVDFNVVKGYGVFVIIGVILGTFLAKKVPSITPIITNTP